MESTPVEDGSLILTALGAAIRDHRLQAGLTQAELAQRAGIGRPHLNHIEGGRKNPTVVVLVHLAESLGVAPGDLLASLETWRSTQEGPDFVCLVCEVDEDV
jgi:transcriptional regulator with XRE-family HTH domain